MKKLIILFMLLVPAVVLSQEIPDAPKPRVITPTFVLVHAALFASTEVDIQRFSYCGCPETFPGLRGTRDVRKVRIAGYASSAGITVLDYVLAKKFKVGKARYVAAGAGITFHVLAAIYMPKGR